MNGLELLKTVREDYPETDVIMLSVSHDDDQIIEAFELGAIDFFQKPIEYKALKISIERGKNYIALKKKSKEIEKQNTFLCNKLNGQDSVNTVFCSEAMRQVHCVIKKLAKDDKISVLITGEFGLCKDSVACCIHNLSSRFEKSYVAVDMSLVTDSIFEKKHFGSKINSRGNKFKLECLAPKTSKV